MKIRTSTHLAKGRPCQTATAPCKCGTQTMLYVDIPTQSKVSKLGAARGETLVSVYLKTTPETQHIGAARTRRKQMTA